MHMFNDKAWHARGRRATFWRGGLAVFMRARSDLRAPRVFPLPVTAWLQPPRGSEAVATWVDVQGLGTSVWRANSRAVAASRRSLHGMVTMACRKPLSVPGWFGGTMMWKRGNTWTAGSKLGKRGDVRSSSSLT